MTDSDQRMGTRVLAQFAAVLADRRLPLFGALLAFALVLPSLRVGLSADDLLHRAVLTGSPMVRQIFPTAVSMFEFLDGDPQRTLRLIDDGVMPWWAFLEMKVAFWRPLTVATHWLDYRLWPDRPSLMHLQNMLWFAAFVLVTGLLYRRLAGPGIAAGLATLLFALDSGHALPAAWVANRSVIIAGVFGVCCLLAHDRWRRGRDRRAGAIAACLLLLSLLTAEAGISTCAYLAAYALCLDHGPLRRRALTLLPAFLIVVVWRIAWTLTGHGIVGAGFYVDPVHDPAGFLVALVQRTPILLLAQFALLPGEIGMVLPERAVQVLWAVALLVVVAAGLIFRPALRRSPLARFWAVGMILALPPMCTTFPSDRMLYFISIGAMGFLAEFLVGTWSPLRRWMVGSSAAHAGASSRDESLPRPGRLVRAIAWGLVILHLGFSPIVLAVRSRYPLGPESMLPEHLYQVDLDSSIEHRDLCVLNAPFPISASYLRLLRELQGLPGPRRLRVIAPALAPVRVGRPDACTLVVAPVGGFGDFVLGPLFRTPKRPMHAGDRVDLTGLSIEVTRVQSNGMPAEAIFRFAVPLEDSSLYWLWWKDHRLVPWTPPAVGETIVLPAASEFTQWF